MDKAYNYSFVDPCQTIERSGVTLDVIQALMAGAVSLWPDPIAPYLFDAIPKLRKGRKVMTFVGDQTWVVTRIS